MTHPGYQAAGFAGRVGFGARPALLVVDVVRAYLDPASPLCLPADAGPPALASIARLLAAARAGGHPVVFTRLDYRPDGSNAPLFFAKVPSLRHLADGSPFAGIAEQVAPADGELVVAKLYASAFAGTPLASWLTARGVDTAVVAGFSTSGCVRATATDALTVGLRPIVVRDATADRTPSIRDANLLDLDAKYADVVDEATALEHLG